MATNNQQDMIRKAKGNPNKNIHHKKNGSNYGGRSVSELQAEKAQKNNPQREPLPTGVKWALIASVGAMMITLILRLAVFPTSEVASCLASLFLGIACLVIFYTRKYTMKDKKGFFYTFLSILLIVIGIAYTLISLLGLATFFGIVKA